MATLNVALVVLGARTGEGRAFRQAVTDRRSDAQVTFRDFDVRKLLRDQTEGHSTRHLEDGTHKRTQSWLFAQPKFVGAVGDSVQCAVVG